MDDMQADRAEAQLRAGVHVRPERDLRRGRVGAHPAWPGPNHASQRGWTVAATFKDDGFSGFKEITRDGFGELIPAIEVGQVDVVIVHDINRLTRNLTDWNAFEKACAQHGVRPSAYTAETWTCPPLRMHTTPGGKPSGRGGRMRSRARESAKAQDHEARQGRRAGGGQRWFGYTRIYANPDESNHRKRHILREDINSIEAEAIRDAVTRVLDHGESVASIARDWTARGSRPVAARQWWPTSIVGTLTSPQLAGLREWQGKKYPTTQWPAIINMDIPERLVSLFADPKRRKHVVDSRAPRVFRTGLTDGFLIPGGHSGLRFRGGDAPCSYDGSFRCLRSRLRADVRARGGIGRSVIVTARR